MIKNYSKGIKTFLLLLLLLLLYTLDFEYRYVTYAKTQIDPRLSKESSQKIVNLYVNDREKAKE